MRPIKKGSTDQSVLVRVIDSSDGTPETSVAYDTAGVDLWYRREGAAAVDITEATLVGADSAHSDGGFIHINDGYCRLDLPDDAVASGANGVMVGGTFTGMIVIGCYIPLVDYDPYDTVRMGLTALPNAAADAAGGLPISDAGGLDLDSQLAATNEVTAARMGALTDWINGGRLDLILDEILADTNELQTDDTPGALTTIEGKIDTIDGFLDTEIAAILEDTGTTLEGHLTDIKGAGWSDENLTTIDANVDAILADTDELQTNQGDWATATGFSTHSAADVWAATNATTSLAYSALLQRAYEILNNKMAVTEADGTVSLKNIGDTGAIASGNVASSSGTTTRAELTWS